jgi:hypothetical protein
MADELEEEDTFNDESVLVDSRQPLEIEYFIDDETKTIKYY